MVSATLWGLDIEVPKSPVKEVPIIEAIKAGEYNRFKKLFDKSKLQKRYSQNQTLLHYASRYNKEKVAQLLIQKGALLSAKGGEYNETPLHMAIRYGYLELALYLIKSHTPLNIVDKYGESPLDISKRLGYTNISQFLIKYGAIKSGDRDSNNQGGEEKVNPYKHGNSVNKYKNGTAVNPYSPNIRANAVELRDTKFESKNKEKNNDEHLGDQNSKIDIGN